MFIGDGTSTLSSLSFPPDGPRSVVLASVSGTVAVKSLRLHRLGTIWEPEG